MTRPPVPRGPHLAALGAAWSAFVVYGSLVPLQFHPMPIAVAIERFRSLPPVHLGLSMGVDWATNVLLFVPLTFLLMGALACDRGVGARLAAAFVVMPFAAAMSVGVEFSQLWFQRTSSLYDVAAETMGGGVGIILWWAVGGRTVTWLRGYAAAQGSRSRLQWILGAYLVLYVTYSVMPLDLTLNPFDLYHKYEDGRIILVPFTFNYDSASAMMYQFFGDTMEFVPVGAWVVVTRRHLLKNRSPLIVGAVGTCAIAAALEFTQLLVMSRFTDATDVVLGTLGGAIGGWLVGLYDTRDRHVDQAVHASRRGQRAVRWLAAITLYTAFLLGGFWFPFALTRDRALIMTRLHGFLRVPFFALYETDDFNALSQILIRLVLFAPLGVLWALLAHCTRTTMARRVTAATGLFYSASVAFCVELGEVFMPSKVADSTEVVLCSVGAAIGLYVTLGVFRARAHENAGVHTDVTGRPSPDQTDREHP